MLRSIVKKIFFKLFNGIAFPAMNSQLKGVKLIVDPLMPNFHFWRDIEIEGHFIYDNFITDGDTIFDIGGNVGLHSSYFTRKNKNSKIYTFEPLPENAAYLRKLIALNKFDNIHLVEKAVSTKTGTVFFDRDKNNHQGHISEATSDLSVQVTTLDDFIEQQQVIPNFIKIDVEGFEGDVLDGYIKNISKSFPFIIIEIHSMEQSRRVGEFFRVLPYSIFRLVDHKEWNHSKQLIPIKNISIDHNAPDGLWGVILAIPNAVKIQYQHLYNPS